jgi:hypothetical protein
MNLGRNKLTMIFSDEVVEKIHTLSDLFDAITDEIEQRDLRNRILLEVQITEEEAIEVAAAE